MIDIRSCTAKYLKENYEIEEPVTELLFEDGLIKVEDAKKVLIREEYNQKAVMGDRTNLKYKLADKYCVSFNLVKLIVYSK
jgi:hypothetical protein